ncbi:acVLRF1 family peptidyl-tRNA hydrolase [Arthrobacter sp. H14]|uniref:acVLRF1 family peptidyl-tRNA hydrolase n=1 Tax=Arthrobacter sp. H14 TaxID=1312959 RepID=UPI00047CE23B|nr:acVLRF1 family peptidyl-tRNA hydrolase [Arthrobacter sp. H14]
MGSRSTSVPPERLVGWLQRFEASHGEVAASRIDEGMVLISGDGTSAWIDLSEIQPSEFMQNEIPPDGDEPIDATSAIADLADAAAVDGKTGVILLRRGGYAIGVVEAGRLLVSKTGTRYVQSRTAAGGWSQQRFARRRANQARGLVETAGEQAVRVISGAEVHQLAYGGDKALCAELIQHRLMAPLVSLPRLPFLDVPDPRLQILQRAALNLNSFPIIVTDP